jgi:hypothetical protein
MGGCYANCRCNVALELPLAHRKPSSLTESLRLRRNEKKRIWQVCTTDAGRKEVYACLYGLRD